MGATDDERIPQDSTEEIADYFGPNSVGSSLSQPIDSDGTVRHMAGWINHRHHSVVIKIWVEFHTLAGDECISKFIIKTSKHSMYQRNTTLTISLYRLQCHVALSFLLM